MAGTQRPPRPSDAPSGAGRPVPLELEPTEVTPAARVRRSRLAFATSVTLAALPVLVVDNLPATADAGGEPVEVAATGEEAPVDLPASTVVTLAIPTDAAAPPTTAVPTTVAAPVATEAPTTTAPRVQAMAAPRPTAPPPTAAPRPAPTTTAPPAPSGNGDPNDPATWDRMAQCESGGNWAANTGNGYYGGLQFSLATWQSYGGTGYPHEASKATQIEVGKRLQAAKGWGAWPGCARALGYT